MKPLILALPLVLLLSSIASAQALKTKYDRFKDETTVYVGPNYVDIDGPRLEVAFYVGYAGTKPARDRMTIGMAVYSSTREWRFISDDNLIVLVDGKRLEIGKPISKDSKLARTRGVDESMAYKISEEQLITISKAEKVEMQIGRTEFALKQSFVRVLRELAESLPK